MQWNFHAGKRHSDLGEPIRASSHTHSHTNHRANRVICTNANGASPASDA